MVVLVVMVREVLVRLRQDRGTEAHGRLVLVKMVPLPPMDLVVVEVEWALERSLGY